MNSNCNHFRMACLISATALLAACSNTGEIKPDSTEVAVKAATENNAVSVVEPVKASKKMVAKTAVKRVPTVKPVVIEQTRKARVHTPPVKRVATAKPVRKPVAKRYTAPKPHIPAKPIVVATHKKAPTVSRQVVKRPVARKAVARKAAAKQVTRPVVRRPVSHRAAVPAKKVVVAQKAHQVPVPAVRIRPAAVPRSMPKRSVYVSPKQRKPRARVQQASYRPAPKQRAAVRRVVQRPARSMGHYSQSRLTGDFAGNYRAQAFIDKMVSRYGFDRGYVSNIISQAKATKWLRKMAYQDANPQLRKKREGEPSWSRYRSRFLTPKHINTGTAFYRKYRRSLERAAAQYGVPSEYILGIMGVETIYGGNVGTDRALDALATMSFMNPRRGTYFESELEAYLLMARRVGLDPTQPKASYAGALGLPQFMPSNIKKYGVDYDGDGAVNLWTPHDAIGSIANYLSKHGWQRGEIAAIPAKRTGGSGYSRMKWGFKHKYSLPTLSRKGLAPVYPGVSGRVHMLKLKTNNGYDYWIGGNNFYVITRYNHSSFYAMAVHELAQAIRKRVKPKRTLPRVIEASVDQDMLLRAANDLL
ncbi:MAG: lytic murein transglycosylase B [Proteobacteria bacterium]|nr:MAG: lytic murein transglycosylase B [Pseudomonadota bacterium]